MTTTNKIIEGGCTSTDPYWSGLLRRKLTQEDVQRLINRFVHVVGSPRRTLSRVWRKPRGDR
jgi:hypothetical protein